MTLSSALTSRADLWKVKATDGRIGNVVRTLDASVGPGDIVVLGICNDVGVHANGGRGGAAEGPLAVRRALARLGVQALHGRRIFDAGDLGPELAVDYDALFVRGEEVLSEIFAKGAIAIVIGGGHDCAYATYRGLRRAKLEPAVVNVDAHLDVRPTHGPSSGNPFYRMLEDGLGQLTEVGLLRDVNEPAHVDYAKKHGAVLSFLDPPATEEDQLRAAEAAFSRASGHAIELSIDLDAINAGSAPGVSWLNPVGLSAQLVRRIAWSAGRAGARALDIMELAPGLDVGTANGRDGVTARLAAFLICDFAAGLAASVETAAGSR